ncbi:unnamed protein product [Closterium sp. NIES-54]
MGACLSTKSSSNGGKQRKPEAATTLPPLTASLFSASANPPLPPPLPPSLPPPKQSPHPSAEHNSQHPLPPQYPRPAQTLPLCSQGTPPSAQHLPPSAQDRPLSANPPRNKPPKAPGGTHPRSLSAGGEEEAGDGGGGRGGKGSTRGGTGRDGAADLGGGGGGGIGSRRRSPARIQLGSSSHRASHSRSSSNRSLNGYVERASPARSLGSPARSIDSPSNHHQQQHDHHQQQQLQEGCKYGQGFRELQQGDGNGQRNGQVAKKRLAGVPRSNSSPGKFLDLPDEVLSAITPDSLQRFSYDDVAAATNEFAPAQLIGEGGFGKVYRGSIRAELVERSGTGVRGGAGERGDRGGGEGGDMDQGAMGQEGLGQGAMVQVAVKQLREESKQGAEEFLREVLVLGRLAHAHLVLLWGYCVDGGAFLARDEAEEGVDEVTVDVVTWDGVGKDQGAMGQEGVGQGAMVQVAVKQLREESKQGAEEFLREVLVLGRLAHAHLVLLWGYCVDGGAFLVYELMEGGSLDYALIDSPKGELHFSWPMRLKGPRASSTSAGPCASRWQKHWPACPFCSPSPLLPPSSALLSSHPIPSTTRCQGRAPFQLAHAPQGGSRGGRGAGLHAPSVPPPHSSPLLPFSPPRLPPLPGAKGELHFSWPMRLKVAVEVAEALVYMHQCNFIHRDIKAANPTQACALRGAGAAAVTLQVAEALVYMHRCNFIHRDIKAANVLLKPDYSAKLTDFGMVQVGLGKSTAVNHVKDSLFN